MKRRTFIVLAACSFAGLKLTGFKMVAAREKAISDSEVGGSPMPTRTLGLTGRKVSIFGLGGESTLERVERQDDAVAIIDRAIDLGVNYIDTSPTYGGGGSEINIGKVMARRRREVFLTSKTHDRSYDGTMRLIEGSLERLQTDYLDLYQVHNLRVGHELDRVLGRNGAILAMEKLKSQGVIKHIGITGHKDPDLLVRGIESYDFDTILLTLNAGDIHYAPFKTGLLQKAVAKRMGIIAMKVTAVNRIVRPAGILSMEEALGYTLSHPVATAIVGISKLDQIDENVRIARNFKLYSEQELAAIEEKTKPHQRQANFFKHDW
ncbi:aldo/keto reductase [Desulfobulbus alkaliphilus]|uniref:aldo/keto reductase n=1 Tax=Desulfobulbus alkaliphilus TaxID=869814 RepID=UPI001964BB45|nr:aldo/keto reductase [Desulfobulbus alkaliphilus]MBM9537112.1 aldo/keto reductase [Desulfobulbus alkaliphilus]